MISQSSAGTAGKVAAFLTLFLITELAVLTPVLLVTVLGVRATPALTRLRDGLERHGRQLTVGLCLGFGALLLAAAARVAIQVA